MDNQLVLTMIFSIIGGLGLFLLGMKNMSEGMQAVAGDRLRRLIGIVTNNRFIACAVGVIVTIIIQSSSATTVILVSMVNAGIMTLTQAIGVILGANIGTTITAWILAVNITDYGLPLLGASIILSFFSSNTHFRYYTTVGIGVGMIFFGLQLMTSGLAPIKEMPAFEAWFAKFTADTYLGAIRCCLTGALVTAIVQSSAATVGITMGLAYNGIIGFDSAAALVLGENIGTTITAVLASLPANRNAKRAAFAHSLFNIIGVTWVMAIFPIFIKVIQWFVGVDMATPKVVDGRTVYPYVMAGIAATHTTFNVANVIFFMPLPKLLAKFLYIIVPDRGLPEEQRLTALNTRFVGTPALGIEQSRKEILKMCEEILSMMNKLKEIILSPSLQTEKSEESEFVFRKERELDVMQKEIVEFISTIMSGNIPMDVAEESRKQLRMADELETVSDYVTNILKLNLKLHNSGKKMTQQGLDAIIDLHDNVTEYVKLIYEATSTSNPNILLPAENDGKTITELMKRYRSEHLGRVSDGLVHPLKSLIYTDMLNAYRRIKDHGLNIAEVLAGEK
ncbi:MAG: Na/Pi cotransporter family protein [Phycisphaerales bacterium]